MRQVYSTKEAKDILKQHFERDQVQSAYLYHLLRVYGASMATAESTLPTEKAKKYFDKAMLLTDQFCLGDQLSNSSAPASAYRQVNLG